MAKVQVGRTGDFNVNRTCNEGRLQREVAMMNFRKATRRPVWAAAAIVLAVTLLGTARSAQAASERRETLSGIASGEDTRSITLLPGEVVLMRGFDFRYLNCDHHIRSIRVLPETDTRLSIRFDDRNGDDPMEYEASLTKVTLAGVIPPQRCTGTAAAGPAPSPSRHHPTGTTSSSSGGSSSSSRSRTSVSPHSKGTATFWMVATIT